ncbi:hypothetical protein [Aerococcus viridans]|uniref:hypothetical protein n=1 Tax=Aerococcus viridans TaxID=1377 RepID=UPI0039B08402
MSAKETLHLVNAGTLKKILKKAGLSGYSAMKKDELVKYVQDQISEEDLAPQLPMVACQTTERDHELVEKYDGIIQRHGPKC